jgi:SPP1 Gp6-like portal protein
MAELTRDGVVELESKLRQQWNTRNAEYDVARMRYYGEHWDADTNPAPLNRYSLTLNYLKPFVDKSIQSLVGRIPAIQVMPPGVDEEARRLAEQIEGVIYGTWYYNDMPDILLKTAWDSFVLRRGIIYVWWDPEDKQVKLKNCAPEHFFPEYDGDRIYRAIYVQRRNTEALKDQYPEHASDIESDDAMRYPFVQGASLDRVGAPGQTTVVDCYTHDGHFYRVMGNAFIHYDLKLPFKCVPFVELPCYPVSGETEPLNMIDQLVELNQYLDQLVSQQADIIQRYANPVVIAKATGQSPEAIRKAMGAPGAVIPVRADGDLTLLGWQGNIPAIDQQMQFVIDSLFDLGGKPRAAFGQQTSQQSGVQTNLSLSPTVQSNEYHESIWGQRLSILNEFILMLWEKNMSGDVIEFQGSYRGQTGTQKYYDVALTGSEIDGWYKNRIKWPSAIRVDDPVYIQNNLQQLTSQPPAMSLYTYLERAGTEDVEAEIDRIQQQLEDPRLHPEVLKSAVDAAATVEGAGLPGTEMGGLAPDAGLGGPPGDLAPDTDLGNGAFGDQLHQSGSPYADGLTQTAKPGY